MNYSSAVMLINPAIRAIKVIYEEDTNKTQAKYIFKTLDQSIQVDDLVVVPTDTRHKMTVVKVIEVDCDVDFESSVELKWAVSKVDTTENQTILAKEGEWIDALKASEKRRRREEIKKNMLDMYKDDGIENMGIANLGVTAIEHKED